MAVATADLHDAVGVRLGDDDQRYTAGRRELVELLAAAHRPLTVAEVLDRADGLTQSSVYRNLSLLERAGVVHRVVTDDEFARFELAEDLTGHHHHHLVCSSCGTVDDFTLDSSLESALDGALGTAASSVGFEVRHHRLDLVGTCRRCRDRRH